MVNIQKILIEALAFGGYSTIIFELLMGEVNRITFSIIGVFFFILLYDFIEHERAKHK
jgi:hypothetical protein